MELDFWKKKDKQFVNLAYVPLEIYHVPPGVRVPQFGNRCSSKKMMRREKLESCLKSKQSNEGRKVREAKKVLKLKLRRFVFGFDFEIMLLLWKYSRHFVRQT